MVQDGEATLWCNVTGKPPPRVTWEWGGQPVRAEAGLLLRNQGQSLHVGWAQAAHSGRYTCVAENVAGRAERRFALSVLGEDPQRVEGGRDAGPAGEHTLQRPGQVTQHFQGDCRPILVIPVFY